MSFIDKDKNTKDFAFELVKNLDVAPIKSNFGRSKNSYCENNRDTELDFPEILQDVIYSKKFKQSLVGDKNMTLTNFLEGISKFKNSSNVQNFVGMIESTIKDYCVREWCDERPAIYPKKSSSENYIEYRATGGKDYPHKES